MTETQGETESEGNATGVGVSEDEMRRRTGENLLRICTRSSSRVNRTSAPGTREQRAGCPFSAS